MKSFVKITCLLLIVLAGFAPETTAQKRKADKDTQNWIYEIEPVAVGSQGSYLIKVWSYSKKPVIAIEQAKKALADIALSGAEGRAWEFKEVGKDASGRALYLIAPSTDGQDPVRVAFTGDDGTTHVSDAFDVDKVGDLFETLAGRLPGRPSR